MFKIVKEPFGDFTKVKIINSDTGEYISIVPEFGEKSVEILSIRPVGSIHLNSEL